MSEHIRTIGNDNEVDRILNRDFVYPGRIGYVEVGEENYCLPIYYRKFEEKLRNFKVRDDDVFVVGFMKTGTTWLAETVWLLVNNFNYEQAKKEIYDRMPNIEFQALFDTDAFGIDPNVDYFKLAEELESPRCIKTHLPWSLLPEDITSGKKNPKLIIILRNPQDVCVSLYYYSQMLEGYKGTFQDLCRLFLAGRVTVGPFWKNVLSYWNLRHRPNLLFVKYKDMKDDLPSVVKRIAKFLDKPCADEDIAKLCRHLSFESMKANPAVNHEGDFERAKTQGTAHGNSKFMRSGKVGGYKQEMPAELIKKFEEWNEENLSGTGLVLE